MPKKPQKWGMKIWCLADAISRYVHDFNIYCGASHYSVDGGKDNVVEGGQGAEVVEKLVGKLAHQGHLVLMDNFFSSVELFQELEKKGIYATGTVRGCRIGLPAFMKNSKVYKKNPSRFFEWKIHESRKICAIMWKDKKRCS
jgi:hypothetical protein